MKLALRVSEAGMADIQYSGGNSPEYGYDYSEYPDETAAGHGAPGDASRVTQLVNWAGALVSMGLVIGMGVWAWQLMMRDVADVPVIRALEGPMRIAPENPGGSVAENQGLAVNRLAEGEEAAPVPDQLTVAPGPIELIEVPQIAADVQEQEFDNASAATPQPEVNAVNEPVEEVAAAEPEDTDALIERLLAEAQPLAGIEESGLPNAADTPDTATPDLVARADTIPISIPGVRRSPRPATRPADLQARALAAAAVAAPAAPEAEAEAAATGVTEDDAGFEIAAAELETGTRLVQLGAFDTPDLARAEWARLAQNYPDFFLGRARVIEEASSGGQTFYRLRAHGFSDLSASRRFCAALVAQGAACIPVTVR
ncbi:SPOR domain-containing protein [Hasllibacter sp. MH4015]|uniref:SPOR domain-containing protein n=1 Tax=Hasllibacter sp. MH4015 TaxID=2854029 RepID=UPI001CD45556|nr:SPOR domain-containing protein [Hasllibacter sp. MH4015]